MGKFNNAMPDRQHQYINCIDIGNARLKFIAISGCGMDSNQVSDNLCAAAEYRLRGFSVVPQMPGAKQPCIKWKPYQTQLPTVDKMVDWWTNWTDAGIALILGSVSGVFVIDVDGAEAHATLVERLGSVPVCPKSISGSGKPYRYHLFFRHPQEVTTNAKYTPWHDKLEFRGAGGIVVVPPSIHPSGNAYRWANGCSIHDLKLPEVPPLVQKELVEKHRHRQKRVVVAGGSEKQFGLSPADRKQQHKIRKSLAYDTQDFLNGDYANSSNWNTRLFNAACDLAGSQVDQETATRWLLDGARPWNDKEEEKAMATIQSAYSQVRSPTRPPKKTKQSTQYSGCQLKLKKPDYSDCSLRRKKQ